MVTHAGTSLYLSLVSPTNSTNWIEGTQQTIQWSTNLTENIKIELYKSTTLIETISVSATGSSLNWTPSMTYNAGNDYKIKISGITNTNISDEQTFTINYATITDNEGNSYKIKQIGNQIWMVDNLKTTKYQNNNTITNIIPNDDWAIATSSAYCWYENNISNKTEYGALYNWYAVNDSRNICPNGYHVPTDDEFSTLVTYLEGNTIAGGKLKEAGFTHWNEPNTGATNSSGFTALPGGVRAGMDGYFENKNTHGNWWTSSLNNPTNAIYRHLYNQYESIGLSDNNLRGGMSVRCIKD